MGVSFVVVCDFVCVCVDVIVGKFGVFVVYDMDEFLFCKDIDVVVVLMLSGLYLVYVIVCVKVGKYVVVEKLMVFWF